MTFVRSFVRSFAGDRESLAAYSSVRQLSQSTRDAARRARAICTIIETIISKKHLLHCRHVAPFFRSAYVNNDKVQLYCLCQCSTAIRWCKCNQSCNISLHERSIGIRIQDSGLYWPFMRGTRRRRKRKRHNAKITRTRKITASRRNALFGMLWGWRHRMLGVEGWNG